MAQGWVFVTGGSRGIGKGIVLHLASAGYRVVFTYRSTPAQAQDVVAAVHEAGGTAVAAQCDGTNAASVNALAAELLAAHGAPKAIVNNAGIARDGLLIKLTDGDWAGVFAANVDATFFVTRAFLPSLMAERAGSIVLMSSVTAVRGNVGQTSYGASKAALLGMARSLAAEVARFNVRVNVILPGLIDTEMLTEIPEKQRGELRKGIPMRRLGTVVDVAELVQFLISDDAGYITGQQIIIDGGLTA